MFFLNFFLRCVNRHLPVLLPDLLFCSDIFYNFLIQVKTDEEDSETDLLIEAGARSSLFSYDSDDDNHDDNDTEDDDLLSLDDDLLNLDE